MLRASLSKSLLPPPEPSPKIPRFIKIPAFWADRICRYAAFCLGTHYETPPSHRAARTSDLRSANFPYIAYGIQDIKEVVRCGKQGP